jgi:hypothetical protein
MGVSVEWAQASYVAGNMQVCSKEDLKAEGWSDAYGSEVTEDFALLMDNGSGLMVIEGSADELIAMAEKIRVAVYNVHPGMVTPSSAEPDKHDWAPGRTR